LYSISISLLLIISIGLFLPIEQVKAGAPPDNSVNSAQSYLESLLDFFGIRTTQEIALAPGDTPIDLGDLTIPVSRIPDWTNAGVDGGIPDISSWPVI